MHASVLKYVVEVARCGSIRKAAQNLFVASSAINRQIRNLEEELGCELFDRLPSGMRPNAAGERLLRHVQSTLHGFHLLRSELDALRGESTGHVAVAAMDSLFVDFLPSAVEHFAQAYPAVTYSVNSTQPAAVFDWLISGKCDIGITYLSHVPAGVEVVAKAALPPGVIMAPTHPLAKQDSISFADCVGHPMLRSSGLAPVPSEISPEFFEFWEAIHPWIVCNNTQMLKRLILGGHGIAVFSKLAFLDELESGDLVWRPLSNPTINAIGVGILVRTHHGLSHVAAEFVDRITRRLKQLEAAANV
jgi:DNA-binding transcriptional LysR family regulator